MTGFFPHAVWIDTEEMPQGSHVAQLGRDADDLTEAKADASGGRNRGEGRGVRGEGRGGTVVFRGGETGNLPQKRGENIEKWRK